MTSAQRQLYSAALRIARAFGTGGATWWRTRATGADPSTAPTLTQVSGLTVRFLENNLIRDGGSLAGIPIYTSPFWGIASADVDIQPGDTLDNGTLAFLVTGAADTSQGWRAIPATPTSVPRSLVLGAGFQAGLRIGAW